MMNPTRRDNQKLLTLHIDRLDLEDTQFEYRLHSSLDSLAASLAEDGQLVPIIVRYNRIKKKYQIISGFRRTRASLVAGITTMRAVEIEAGDEEAHRISILENENRKDYNDLDRANAIKKMRGEGKRGEEVARIMGISRMHLHRLEKLLSLPEVLKRALIRNEIDTSKALLVKKIVEHNPGVTVEEVMEETIEKELTKGELERRLKALSTPRYGKQKRGEDGVLKETAKYIQLRGIKLAKQRLPKGKRREKIIEELKKLIMLLEGKGEKGSE